VIDTWHSVCGDTVYNNKIASMLCEAGGYLSGEVFAPLGAQKGCGE